MLTIGFSTGALARGDFVQGLRLLEDKHVEAVELSALRYTELPDILTKLPLHLETLGASCPSCVCSAAFNQGARYPSPALS